MDRPERQGGRGHRGSGRHRPGDRRGPARRGRTRRRRRRRGAGPRGRGQGAVRAGAGARRRDRRLLGRLGRGPGRRRLRHRGRLPPPLQQRRRDLGRGRAAVGAGGQRLDLVLLGQRLRRGQRHAVLRPPHDRVGRARRGGQHVEHGRWHRPGALRLGLRLEQGGHLVPDRGAGPPAGRGRAPSCGPPSSTPRAGCSIRGCGRPSATGPASWPGSSPGRRRRARPSRSSRPSWPRPGAPVDVMDLRELGRFCVRGSSGATSSSATGSTRAPPCCTAGPTPSPRAGSRRPR